MKLTQQLIELHKNHTLKSELLEWAQDGTDTDKEVLDRLQEVNCAGCSGPAPIYYGDMADKVALVYDEIQNALEEYTDTTGECWNPKKGDSFLNFLWFAYEWNASELVSELEGLRETALCLSHLDASKE